MKWHYETVLVQIKLIDQDTQLPDIPGGSANVTLNWEFVADGPSGESVVGLTNVLNAWASEGWELDTLYSTRLQSRRDVGGTPEMPQSISVDIDVIARYAVFKREAP